MLWRKIKKEEGVEVPSRYTEEGGRKGLHEKLTFEHKTEIHFSGTSILGEKTTKAVRQWIGLKCPKNSKKASKAAIY